MAPAKSAKQQRFFGMVESGKIPAPKGMTSKQVEEFAATARTGLPTKASQPKMQKMGKK